MKLLDSIFVKEAGELFPDGCVNKNRFIMEYKLVSSFFHISRFRVL